jgi:hypothetical protein
MSFRAEGEKSLSTHTKMQDDWEKTTLQSHFFPNHNPGLSQTPGISPAGRNDITTGSYRYRTNRYVISNDSEEMK